MKRYISILIPGIILIFILDYAAGKTLSYFYLKSTSGVLYETTFAIEKNIADILILGSSRAKHHYDSKLLEEKTGLTTYNTGRDGNYIFYQTAILKSTLLRHLPKQIILDFNGSFKNLQEDYDRLSSLLPYYKNHEEIRQIIDLKSPFEKYKLLSKTFPYNSLLTTIAAGNIGLNNEVTYNGYSPLFGVWEGSLDSIKTEKQYKIDQNKYAIFEELINLSKNNKIPLLVVYSPVYFNYDFDYSLEVCKEICEKNNIQFIDFSKDQEFLENQSLFKDQTHLNETGAKIFTSKILEIIS